ncbi:MAG: Ferric iron ABC transporter, iron-binding protein, partial [uncultured Solirubrobacteraceae bacterium]
DLPPRPARLPARARPRPRRLRHGRRGRRRGRRRRRPGDPHGVLRPGRAARRRPLQAVRARDGREGGGPLRRLGRAGRHPRRGGRQLPGRPLLLPGRRGARRGGGGRPARGAAARHARAGGRALPRRPGHVGRRVRPRARRRLLHGAREARGPAGLDLRLHRSQVEGPHRLRAAQRVVPGLHLRDAPDRGRRAHEAVARGHQEERPGPPGEQHPDGGGDRLGRDRRRLRQPLLPLRAAGRAAGLPRGEPLPQGRRPRLARQRVGHGHPEELGRQADRPAARGLPAVGAGPGVLLGRDLRVPARGRRGAARGRPPARRGGGPRHRARRARREAAVHARAAQRGRADDV